jgi:hypothetical protein
MFRNLTRVQHEISKLKLKGMIHLTKLVELKLTYSRSYLYS